MRTSVQAAVACVALSALRAAAQEIPPPEEYKLRVEYRQWLPALDTEIQKGSGGEAGTLLDGKNDLGLSDERTFEVTGALQFKSGHKLRGSYTRIDYDGDVSARRTFRFDDTIFNRFTRVVSSVKGSYFTGEYEFDIVRGFRGYLGGIVGAKVFDLDYVIVAPEQGDRETDTQRVPIPILGVVGRVYAGRLSFSGELSGLTLGQRGAVWEADVAARLHISDRLAVQGGYRSLKLRAKDAPDKIEMTLSGWNVGLELSL
jgi:hypothetical protein